MCIFDVCYFATHKQLEIDVFRTGDMGIVSLGEEHNANSTIHFLEGSSQVFRRSKKFSCPGSSIPSHLGLLTDRLSLKKSREVRYSEDQKTHDPTTTS